MSDRAIGKCAKDDAEVRLMIDWLRTVGENLQSEPICRTVAAAPPGADLHDLAYVLHGKASWTSRRHRRRYGLGVILRWA